MKIARYSSIAMLGFLVVATGAKADPVDNDPSSSPFFQSDPDGVPLTVTQPQSKPLTQTEVEVIHKQLERAAADKNWLQRDYEQAQAHSGDSSGNQSENIYSQLSSNKDLAQLAGLPTLGPNGDNSSDLYRTGTTSSDHGSATLRPNTASSSAGNFPSQGNFFKPLVTPLGSPGLAGLHNFYMPTPLSMTSPYASILPQVSLSSKTDPSQDSLDLETPGLIAAEKNPATDTNSSDLTLDILPGETVEHAREHQDNNNSLELPEPMDADQLHKTQAAPPSVPTAPTAHKTATTTPVKVTPTDDPNAPMPVSKEPQISPVREPIASPYDILNR